MALEKSRFFDSVGNDRTYQADSFAEYFRMFLSDGILNGGSNLQVKASGAGLSVSVDYGMALIRGYGYWLVDDKSGRLVLQIEAAHSSMPRIDRVVLRLDRSLQERTIKAVVKTGTPAAAPSPPPLTRTGNLYELSLAQVRIPSNAATLTTADNVTDERLSNSVCGLINSLITLDASHFNAQAQAILSQLSAQGYLPRTGGKMSGLIDMDGNRLANIPPPIALNDPAPLSYLNEKFCRKSSTGRAIDSDQLGGKTAAEFATSTQGTKADNALPKSSYTAADVLTKIKSVGGAGSGLDADTVDGKHASNFATSTQGTKADNALPKSSYTAADVLAKIKSVGGSGSGLDADLLDGVEGSEYLRRMGANQNLGTIPVVQGRTTTGGSRIAFTDGAGKVKHTIGSNDNSEALKIINVGTGGVDVFVAGNNMMTITAQAGMSLNNKRIPNYSIGTGDPPTLALGELYFKV